MAVRRDFPHVVEEIGHCTIPVANSCHLAARIWRPADAAETPVPAILEFIPYRKRDGTAERDAANHRWFAGMGYAVVRADLRGSGDSEGLLEDEYLEQEQADACEVIAWIAAQPWCSGAVGMMGISWGGFNALQVAARRPPALKAVITLASTDDRYADDIHTMGGCLLNDNLSWSATMFGINSAPPDPALLGPRWRDLWLARLEGNRPWLLQWLAHQRRDDFWRQGSVCEDFAAIQCPVYAVAGWADGYSNTVPRLLAGLQVPAKGLVGPWGHRYPDQGRPGPAIGFLGEALRWWDQWLKGRETGIMAEPRYRVWMQDTVAPRAEQDRIPGRWVAEAGWPAPGIEPWHLALNPGRLEAEPGAERPLALTSPQTAGLTAGRWFPSGLGPELTLDQRAELGGALVFETDPLSEPVEILGAPKLELVIGVDKPVAMIAACLCDRRPDGSVARVTYGLLNLTHRAGHAEPRPLIPGERIRVSLQLNDIAQRFPAGHRILLTLATSYWPIAWPAPEPVVLTLHSGASRLELPRRRARSDDADLTPFGEPETGPPLAVKVLEPASLERRVETDAGSGRTDVIWKACKGHNLFEDTGLAFGAWSEQRYSIDAENPLSARAESRWTLTWGRGDWQVRTETRTVMTSDARDFRVEASLEAFETQSGDPEGTATRSVFQRQWDETIPRDLV